METTDVHVNGVMPGENLKGWFHCYTNAQIGSHICNGQLYNIGKVGQHTIIKRVSPSDYTMEKTIPSDIVLRFDKSNTEEHMVVTEEGGRRKEVVKGSTFTAKDGGEGCYDTQLIPRKVVDMTDVRDLGNGYGFWLFQAMRGGDRRANYVDGKFSSIYICSEQPYPYWSNFKIEDYGLPADVINCGCMWGDTRVSAKGNMTFETRGAGPYILLKFDWRVTGSGTDDYNTLKKAGESAVWAKSIPSTREGYRTMFLILPRKH